MTATLTAESGRAPSSDRPVDCRAAVTALANRPGAVVSRAELISVLPRGEDAHAVDMAVARLRAALGSPHYVETVIKHGYRLRIDAV